MTLAPLPAPTEYTDLDFDALRARLFALYQSRFPERDLDTDEVAIIDAMLLECFAWVGEVLTFLVDERARNAFLAFVYERGAALALAYQYSYQPKTPAAATVEVIIRLAAPPLDDVVIAAGRVVKTQAVTEPVNFHLLTEATIAAGADPPETTITAEHSESHSQIVATNNQANLQVLLPRAPFLDGSLILVAGDGVYEVVSSFVDTGPTDRHATVSIDAQDRAIVQFGDGEVGAIPQGSISIQYKTGGGTIGNLEQGALRVFEGTLLDNSGASQQVTVVQEAKASGGAARETIDSIRRNAPASLRALTRSVAKEDFEINARRVEGVARALMLTSNEYATVDENSGVLLIIPEGGGLPTQTLKDAVSTLILEDYPPPLTFQLSVQDPIYEPINIWARIKLVDGADPNLVRQALLAVLEAFFEPVDSQGLPNPLVTFGGSLTWSDIFATIQNTLVVRSLNPSDLTLNTLNGNLSLAAKEFPALGEVTLINASTGLAL